MDAIWLPFEFLFAAIAGVLFVVSPGFRRKKLGEWVDAPASNVRNEVIGWLVCFCATVVLIAFVLPVSLQ